MTTPGHSSDFFRFDYRPIDGHHSDDSDAGSDSPRLTSENGPEQRLSRYWDIERLSRGPQPPPSWVVTAQAALDTELGILKTGKEAEVFLLRRTAQVPDRSGGPGQAVMAAKRYRDPDHRAFRRSSIYTDNRGIRRSRDARALNRKSSYGRQVAAAQWAIAEWGALVELWEAGVPVPYPVQIDEQEILMEFIGDPSRLQAAPRLAQVRPDIGLVEHLLEQLTDAMVTMAGLGYAHGDLSPYNILVDGPRLVIIDLPQLIDLAGNPHAMELLQRDCRNVAAWFTSRGREVDPDELFSQVAAYAF